MLQLENDDLIPRSVPKPSISNVATSVCRPSVPEISIVFSEKQSEHLPGPPSSVITSCSYSVWKNKCLPSVSYSTEASPLCTELCSNWKISNVFPMRAEDVVIPQKNCVTRQVSENKSEYLNRTNKTTESPRTPYFIETQTVTSEENILKVSAETQTDKFLDNHEEFDVSNLATKEDVAEIKSMMLKMEMEQRQLIKTLQDLLKDKTIEKNRPELRDVGTQSDKQFNEGTLIGKAEESDCYLKDRNATDYYLSKGQTADFQRTATEQSIVMNELAVKYLRNATLNDMLQDVSKAKTHLKSYESSLKNKENFEKSPTDMSTASYKYLRKYRLLPEENNNLSPQNDLLKLKSEDKLDNMLDLEIIRCKPKFK